MPNEMTAGEAAERLAKRLEHLAFQIRMGEHNPNYSIAYEAAEFLRRVASGKLAEVVHAHWEYRGCGWPYCSNCDTNALEGGDEEPVESDHCPNCGALMGKDDSHA